MTTPTYRNRRREEPALPFDTTQAIDPAFADLLERAPEPTLTDADFADLAPKPVPAKR